MNIQEQIEVLTQELRPCNPYKDFWFFNGTVVQRWSGEKEPSEDEKEESNYIWRDTHFASTDKAEVEEYADCYHRLKLYQLLGKKAEKESPIDWANKTHSYIGTDFTQSTIGDVYSTALASESQRYCVLGGVWFSREEDRLEALKQAGIDEAFQEKCAKYGLGGA
jgi:hypothetical protein